MSDVKKPLSSLAEAHSNAQLSFETKTVTGIGPLPAPPSKPSLVVPPPKLALSTSPKPARSESRPLFASAAPVDFVSKLSAHRSSIAWICAALVLLVSAVVCTVVWKFHGEAKAQKDVDVQSVEQLATRFEHVFQKAQAESGGDAGDVSQ